MMKKKAKNLLGVLLLSLAIAVTQIPVPQSDAAAPTADFQLDGTTLVKYTGTASTVSIPASVTKIGEEAFADNASIYSVTIPKGVESIGYGAFYNCTGLHRVSIPDTVTELGNGVFSGCSNLSSVTIGTGVVKLGSGVFSGCESLETVDIAKGNEKFVCDGGVIYNKDKTIVYQMLNGRKGSSYAMPSTVEEVREYSFWGCNQLKHISLSNNVAGIQGYTFSNCKSLESITIPYTVKSIDMKAFEDCVNLDTVVIPSSVSSIHDTAFDGCSSLTLQGEEGTYAGTYAEVWNQLHKDLITKTEYEEDGNVQEEDPVDQNNTQDNKKDAQTEENTVGEDDSVEKDNSVEEDKNQVPVSDSGKILGTSQIVGNQAVVFIDNTEIEVLQGQNEKTVSAQKETKDGIQEKDASWQEVNRLVNSTGEKGAVIPKYTIVNEESIADQAFYKKTSLTEYEIPKGITQIGEFAFARSGLTRIIIPEGVESIGYGAFYHCDSLHNVSIPTTVNQIEPEAFSDTPWLTQWLQGEGEDFLIVGDGILLGYRGQEEQVQIPEGVTQIAPAVFAGHTEILTVLLPESLRIIGEDAFQGCANLRETKGGSQVTDIKDRAFADCALDTIWIPASVTHVGLRAYDFSNTGKEPEQKVVVLQGKDLPTISYERTASRLSNEAAREIAFKDVLFAVLTEGFQKERVEDSIISNRQNGFRGILCSMDSENMTVNCEDTTLYLEELSQLKPPQTISIGGESYAVTGYDKLLNQAKSQESNVSGETGSVQVVCAQDELDASRISAVLEGNNGTYQLVIKNSKEAAAEISTAYRALYQTDIEADLYAYDLQFIDTETEIPITKLGNQKLKVTLPVPGGMTGRQLRILCMDRNGQLEELSYEKEERNGEEFVTFTTNHFSAYGIYGISNNAYYGEGTVIDGKVTITSFSKKDVSPDTGDPIHPKWFLATGLFFAAMAVFFIKYK